RARALIFALHHHQIVVGDVDFPPCGAGLRPRVRRPEGLRYFRFLARLPGDRVQERRRRIEVERVAELVRLRRAGRLHAGRLLARVVAAVAALAERAEQIAQRAVAEEVERLVGDLEGHRRLIRAAPAALAPLALALEIRRCGDVAL